MKGSAQRPGQIDQTPLFNDLDLSGQIRSRSLCHVAGWDSYYRHDLARVFWVVNTCYTYLAQHLVTACQDLEDLDNDIQVDHDMSHT